MFRHLWNFVVVALLLYTFIIMPWAIAFEEIDKDHMLYYVDIIVDTLFVLDIMINLNTYFISEEG